MNVALVVFAKPPLRGRVKTRMHGALTPEAAARMYEAGLRDIVARVQMLGVSVQIAYVDMPGGDGFFAAAFPDIPRFAQVGSDLGARMAAAIERLFRSGRDAVVIVGADVPTLPIAYLEEALVAVRQTSLVFGPAEDGGYYLIGVQHDAWPSAEVVFEGIPWSTPEVLSHSLTRARNASIPYHLLPSWYDVDEPADLERAVLDVERGSHLDRWLRDRR